MSTDIFQGRQISISLSATYCERCGRREQCVTIISHKPDFPYDHQMKLCLDRCWIELGNAIKEKRMVYNESWEEG